MVAELRPHTCCHPATLGQVVSGRLDFDVRIVLHNNPSHLRELSVADDDGFRHRISLDLDCPYDGVNESTCAFNVPVSLDTTELRDGWRELRIRAVAETPDGKRFLNSSGIPIDVQNGGSDSDYNRFCGNTSLIGRGWYEGFDYTNAIIECVPLEPVSGVHTFRVRAQKSSAHLTVALDRTHFIPAVGPWPAQQASTGQILFDEDGDFGSFFPITIDTRQLPDGWHTLAVTSTSPDRGTSRVPLLSGRDKQAKGRGQALVLRPERIGLRSDHIRSASAGRFRESARVDITARPDDRDDSGIRGDDRDDSRDRRPPLRRHLRPRRRPWATVCVRLGRCRSWMSL